MPATPTPTAPASVMVSTATRRLEVSGGLLLLVVSPATIDRVVTSLTQHELSEDPTTSWPPTFCAPPTG